jgi:CBS domain-containing protein
VRPNFPLGIALRRDEDAPLTGQFQRLNRIIPEDQELQYLSTNTSVEEALKRLKETGFSQMPVMHEGEIIGVFSFRSFALGALKFEDNRTNVLTLNVDEFLEELPYKSWDEPFEDVIDDLDRLDAVLVGTPTNPVAIISSMDVLRYLYGVTSPFVLIGEIELAIRALMSWSASETQLDECFRKTLAEVYKERKVPNRIEDLTFGDYVTVIGHGDNWEKFFKTTFGSTRQNVRTRLSSLIDIRNDMLHFRRVITVAEFDELTEVRDWLLRRCKMVQRPPARAKLEVA